MIQSKTNATQGRHQLKMKKTLSRATSAFMAAIISACGGGGGNGSSQKGTPIVLTDAGSISSLTAKALTASQIQIEWNENIKVNGAEIKLEKRKSGEANFMPYAKVRTGIKKYVALDLEENTSYDFQAMLVFPNSSNPVLAATAKTPKLIPDPEALKVPSNVVATYDQDGERISLSWAYPGATADGFIVERSEPMPGTQANYAGNIFQMIDNGSAFGTIELAKTYSYKVYAVVGTRISDAAKVSMTTPSTLPSPVLQITSASTTFVALNWNRTVTVDDWTLSRVPSTQSPKTVSSQGFVDDANNGFGALQAGQTYTYKLKARRGVFGSAEVSVNVTIPAANSVINPTNLVASSNRSDGIKLDWTSLDGNMTSFDIERGQAGTSFVFIDNVNASTRSYTDFTPSLIQGASYQYRIKGKANVNGTTIVSDYTNTATGSKVASTTFQLAKPTGFGATKRTINIGSGSIMPTCVDFTWNWFDSAHNSDIDSFELWSNTQNASSGTYGSWSLRTTFVKEARSINTFCSSDPSSFAASGRSVKYQLRAKSTPNGTDSEFSSEVAVQF